MRNTQLTDRPKTNGTQPVHALKTPQIRPPSTQDVEPMTSSSEGEIGGISYL